jgi:hypothetical protein
MAEGSELEQLAQRYLDLWQDQVSALAADGEFTDMMGRLTAALGPAAAAAPWALWPAMLGAMTPGAGAGANWPPFFAGGGVSGAGRPEEHGDKATAPGAAAASGRTAGAAPGAAAAAAAPLGGGPDLGELARRLAALEERIAALEAGPGTARTGPRGGSKGRKPAKGRT